LEKKEEKGSGTQTIQLKGRGKEKKDSPLLLENIDTKVIRLVAGGREARNDLNRRKGLIYFIPNAR